MKAAIQIMPLALLLGGAAIAVWRGFDDPSARKARKAAKKWKSFK